MRTCILFLKSGNPWHDWRGRFASGPADVGGGGSEGDEPTLPSSAHVRDAASARDYFATHLEGREFKLTMRTGKGIYPIKAVFPPGNHHAWTRAARPGEPADAFDQPSKRIGKRVYDPERAPYMDRLLPTLRNAWKVLDQNGEDVVIQAGQMPDGRAYTAAFKIRPNNTYEFASAYPRTQEEVRALVTRFRPKPPLRQKANTLAKEERMEEQKKNRPDPA